LATVAAPALLALAGASSVAGQEVADSSYVAPDGRRVLHQSAVVDAPIDSVWSAFTTSEGLRSFVAPVAAIDLRIGGRWEASYDAAARIGDSANIVNEILSYLPRRMLSIRVRRAPPGFPYPGAVKELWTVIELREIPDGRVRVATSMAGYRSGEPWDDLYAAFRRDNAIVLRRLVRRFRTGPIDWAAEAGGQLTPAPPPSPPTAPSSSSRRSASGPGPPAGSPRGPRPPRPTPRGR